MSVCVRAHKRSLAHSLAHSPTHSLTHSPALAPLARHVNVIKAPAIDCGNDVPQLGALRSAYPFTGVRVCVCMREYMCVAVSVCVCRRACVSACVSSLHAWWWDRCSGGSIATKSRHQAGPSISASTCSSPGLLPPADVLATPRYSSIATSSKFPLPAGQQQAASPSQFCLNFFHSQMWSQRHATPPSQPHPPATSLRVMGATRVPAC